MTAQNFGPCQLHVPHKDWADEIENLSENARRQSRENWSEVERWVNERFPNCVGGCDCYIANRVSTDGSGGPGAILVPSGAPTTIPYIPGIVCGTRPTSGNILVVVNAIFVLNPAGTRHLAINGGLNTAIDVPAVATSPSGTQGLSITSVSYNNATYGVSVWQDSGGPLPVFSVALEYALCKCSCFVPPT